MTVLLGGDARPLGAAVQFLAAPVDDVLPLLADAFWSSPAIRTDTGLPLPRAVDSLLPLAAPWTRMLVGPAGDWTAVVNNFVSGGDPTAPGPFVSQRLGIRCVVAQHAPSYGPGHAATQLFVHAPGGDYMRTLSAHATDGRWSWHESGEAFAFEEAERYSQRLKRKRFDRDMLLRYLMALGIIVDDDAYGVATLLQKVVVT